MKKWEYVHVTLFKDDIIDTCQRYGLDGWELASLVVASYETNDISGKLYAYQYAAAFKRMIDDDEEQ